MTRRYLPGSAIGVMGGGQLGRMFAISARRMGYRVHVFIPEADSPAGQVADRATVADYGDEAAVKEFARAIEVLTFEFENIPVQTVDWCGEYVSVRPSGAILHTAQHRLREKTFLRDAGIPVANFRAVQSESDLRDALENVGTPSILKTAGFGYDGKGQQFIDGSGSAEQIWVNRPGDELILEQAIDFALEISVIVARTAEGAMATFPVSENIHSEHILDVTVVPARVSAAVAEQAVHLAREIAGKLELVGLLAVEMFVTRDNRLVVNELAPRPHNSGHWTIEGCVTSQFEQQLRAVCGLSLGSTELLRPTAMANLLGDLWHPHEPNWAAALDRPAAHLHLYGKREPRPRRKMGHITSTATSADLAVEAVRRARDALRGT
ncbi:MAG: 5-(carboxyamino)imidazole ribonucleotide synthase [Chthoniobacterales bacterium]